MYYYTSQARVEDYIKRSLTQHEVIILPVLMEAARNYIDEYTESSFEPSGDDDTSRFFDGNSQCEIDIDPMTSITKVEYLDRYGAVLQELGANDYRAYPLNKAVKTSLRVAGAFKFPHGVSNIKVTGKFGSSPNGELPGAITLAATSLVAEYLQSDERNIKSEETEGWKVAYDSTTSYVSKAADLLAPYRRLKL